MKRYSFFYAFFIVAFALGVIACSDDDAPDNSSPDPDPDIVVTLNLVDKSATVETKALYSNLWAVSRTGFMFGHHDDLMYGRKWYNEQGRSDTKDVCGDYPAVYSLDFSELMDERHTDTESTEIRRRCILEARRRGEVIIACAHLNNPLTGGDAWDNTDNTVVKEILTDGSPTQQKFKEWLDRLAEFVLSLKDDSGKLIPIIFRPFHEHTQTWSWWGSACTTENEFIDLWRFTVNYLKNTKGVHQFIYAISPQMDRQKTEEDFLYRWPGDDYVDFIGMDCYQGLSPTVFAANIKAICRVSDSKLKPCGVTETGVEGFTDANYWTTQILTPATGRTLSMIVMWRNKFVGADENDKHYFSIFKGHPSEADFMKFYKSNLTFFSNDLPDMYSMADGINIQ